MTNMSGDYENIPDELKQRDQWLLWDSDADKPRQPHWNGDFYGVSWNEPTDWHSFDEAVSLAETKDSWGIGYVVAKDNPDYAHGIYGCLDLDGCAQDHRGGPKEWLPSLGMFMNEGFYAEYSASGYGIHIPIVGQDVPEWWTDSHFSDEEHEGVEYLTHKFIAFTGDQMRESGNTVCDQDPTEFLRKSYETINDETPKVEQSAGGSKERAVKHSASEVTDIETTDDMDVILDAIEHTDPSDIRIRSPVTKEYSSGKDINYARDPSWAQSRSGTRIAEFDDGFVNRKGMHGLDCLQLVALEERIISSSDTYPEGEDFREAVRELRDRGASIPKFEPSDSSPSLKGNRADREFEAADGGTEVKQPTPPDEVSTDSPPEPGSQPTAARTLRERVQDVIDEYATEEITKETARHNIVNHLLTEFDFVYPEERVRGWREKLYVYSETRGIYEPRGERVIEKKLEYLAGDFVTNQAANEIVGKIKRRASKDRDMFKGSPHRMVVANGILNLHTGQLTDHTPDEYHHQRIDINWNPDAERPDAIISFIKDIVEPGDVQTMLRLISHTLYKEYIAEKAAILLGNGENGKSVFLRLIENFLEPAEDNVAHRELQDLDEYQFAPKALRGRLANLATEVGEQEVKDTTTFKKLTGQDTMTADVKHESEIEFENFATMMFATNEMPVFGQDNHAIWRRWLLIEFPYTFSSDNPDAKDPVDRRTLMNNMTTDKQLEGLLLWCQKEIQRWHQTDQDFFADAARADEVREKMKKAAEPVFAFATACLEPADEDTYLRKDRVRSCYQAFADAEDLPKLKSNVFGERLMSQRELSIAATQVRINGTITRVYESVDFSSRGRQLLGVNEPDDDSQQAVDDAREYEQVQARVMELVRTLVDKNDGNPVPVERVAWSASTHDIGKSSAENAVNSLAESGRVVQTDGTVLPVDR